MIWKKKKNKEVNNKKIIKIILIYLLKTGLSKIFKWLFFIDETQDIKKYLRILKKDGVPSLGPVSPCFKMVL